MFGDDMLVHFDQSEVPVILGNLKAAQGAMKNEGGRNRFEFDYILKFLRNKQGKYTLNFLGSGILPGQTACNIGQAVAESGAHHRVVYRKAISDHISGQV
jgi:carbon monoxide dehydrogenase subunit G